MFSSLKFKLVKFNIFSTITVALIVFVIILADNIISNAPLVFDNNQLQTHQSATIMKITSEAQPENKLKPEDLSIFQPSDHGTTFDPTVRNFFSRHHCKVQVFMTWFSPVESFGEREFVGLDSLFQTNPEGCLVILSKTMASEEGFKILEPLIRRGFRVHPTAPDLWDLVKNTPAETWLADIRDGIRNPGEIPLAQNLSNLIRLAVLYKYGGVYLDFDFIILKDFSGLKNSIGAQSVGQTGNWTRLNNAVLIFDKNHSLVYKFLEEFGSSFNGNKWGHNGPYLVSRVVAKTGELCNVTILPPAAFYPVAWTKVGGFFTRPSDRVRAKWVEAKIRQLNGSSFGVHLWNSQSSRLKIEGGSIIGRLISDHCVICRHRFS